MRSRLLSCAVLVVLAASLPLMVSAQSRKRQPEVFSIRAKAFDQQGYKLNFVMPQNWDKDKDAVQIFGYYGENGEFQDVVTPVSVGEFGNNLLIEFPESVRTHPNGMTLHHIDVEVKVTNQRATSGFGFKQLAK